MGVEILAGVMDKIYRSLLSKYIDRYRPRLDPAETIDKSRIEKAAKELKLARSEVKSRYETLAREYGFKLGWKYEP